MEWVRVDTEMAMDKAQRVKGRESALWVSAVPGLRPGTRWFQ